MIPVTFIISGPFAPLSLPLDSGLASQSTTLWVDQRAINRCGERTHQLVRSVKSVNFLFVAG